MALGLWLVPAHTALDVGIEFILILTAVVQASVSRPPRSSGGGAINTAFGTMLNTWRWASRSG